MNFVDPLGLEFVAITPIYVCNSYFKNGELVDISCEDFSIVTPIGGGSGNGGGGGAGGVAEPGTLLIPGGRTRIFNARLL
jgi:hypothetical protein